jgi:hypothetical protein
MEMAQKGASNLSTRGTSMEMAIQAVAHKSMPLAI